MCGGRLVAIHQFGELILGDLNEFDLNADLGVGVIEGVVVFDLLAMERRAEEKAQGEGGKEWGFHALVWTLTARFYSRPTQNGPEPRQEKSPVA